MKPLTETYRGFKRIRQEPIPHGFGTHAICAVTCSYCGVGLERSANAVRMALKRTGRFRCSNACQGSVQQ